MWWVTVRHGSPSQTRWEPIISTNTTQVLHHTFCTASHGQSWARITQSDKMGAYHLYEHNPGTPPYLLYCVTWSELGTDHPVGQDGSLSSLRTKPRYSIPSLLRHMVRAGQWTCVTLFFTPCHAIKFYETGPVRCLQLLGIFFGSRVGSSLYPEIFYTMILQRIRIIVGDAGFESGTSAPEVWCATTTSHHISSLFCIGYFTNLYKDKY